MRRFLNLTLCIILLATPCFAVYPGPRFIKKCPKCGQPVIQSPATRDAFPVYRNWTDGREVACYYMRKWLVREYEGTPPLAKCPKCSHFFWIAKAEELASWYFYDEGWVVKDEENKRRKVGWDDEPVKKAVNLLDPTESDYYEAIASLGGNKKDEKYLRIRGWNLANDRWRFNTDKDVPAFSEKTIENLRSLSAMLDEKDEN
jgi:hypothetical protein